MYAVVMILGTINVMGVQPVVAMERIVLYRESAARMYSELAYAFGQVWWTNVSNIVTDFVDRYHILKILHNQTKMCLNDFAGGNRDYL
jgi:hypothetical protein